MSLDRDIQAAEQELDVFRLELEPMLVREQKLKNRLYELREQQQEQLAEREKLRHQKLARELTKTELPDLFAWNLPRFLSWRNNFPSFRQEFGNFRIYITCERMLSGSAWVKWSIYNTDDSDLNKGLISGHTVAKLNAKSIRTAALADIQRQIAFEAEIAERFPVHTQATAS